jgi:hypothetical protein
MFDDFDVHSIRDSMFSLEINGICLKSIDIKESVRMKLNYESKSMANSLTNKNGLKIRSRFKLIESL